MNHHFKVGRITVALGLVAFGIALLLGNLGVWSGALSLIARFWPLLLIGYGVEYLVQSLLIQRSGEERRIRWDVGGAFLLAILIFVSLGITAFRNYVFPGSGPFNINFGPSESRSETKTAQMGSARELVAEIGVGSITVNPAINSSEIRVEATYTAGGILLDRSEIRRQLDAIKLTIADGDPIRITTDAPSTLNNISVHYTIYAPEGLKVRAQTGAGSITSTGYKGDMQFSSNVGRIDVSAGTGSLTATSGSGSISIRDFEGPVEAKTNVGSLDVRNVNGALQLNSRTGSITVRDFRGGGVTAETGTGRVDVLTNSVLEGNVSLKAQTGSVGLELPKESSVRATAQTRTGSLNVPGFMSPTRSGTASSAVGTSGDGKYTVTLEASTGSVRLIAH